MNRTHRILIAATGGWAGTSFSGMPVLELTTTGRKSGQLRSTMLTSPYQEGDRTYIVASRGGDDHSPAWFLNLRDNPEVAVSIQGGPAQKMLAEVTDPDERGPAVAPHHLQAHQLRRVSEEDPARDPPRGPHPDWELRTAPSPTTCRPTAGTVSTGPKSAGARHRRSAPVCDEPVSARRSTRTRGQAGGSGRRRDASAIRGQAGLGRWNIDSEFFGLSESGSQEGTDGASGSGAGLGGRPPKRA